MTINGEIIQNNKNLKGIKIFSLTSIIFLMLLLAVPLQTSYGTMITHTVAAGTNDLSYSPSPPTISFDKDSYGIGEDATFTIDEFCNNKFPGIPDFFSTVVTQSSSTTTVDAVETGISTGFFDGTFLTTDEIQNIDTKIGPEPDETALVSWEICTTLPGNPGALSAEITVVMATSGTITTGDVSAELEDGNLSCEIRPVTDILHVQLESGTLTADNISVTMSYEDGVFEPDDLEAFLDMFYQVPGFGWAKISDHTFDPDDSSIDFVAKTVTSDPIDAGFFFPVTEGRYVIGYDVGCAGGGGGGLVRPSLVINALAGIGGGLGSGGGSAYSSPTLQLSNLVKLGIVDVPFEVEQMIYNHDSTVPATAFGLGFFEDFDFPLIINDKGFVLSGYETTIETQTLQTNTPHTFKFLFYESEKIQHFSLYTNLSGANSAIHQSDTQILYNDGQEIKVVDPNGFFESVSLTLNEIDDIKKQIVLEITFAKEMATTDMIVRSWDPFLNSFDTYILKAFEVVSETIEESTTPTFEAPVIEELESQSIPKWIKNNAAWWSDQQISDNDFVSGIEYLIKNGIINVPGVEVGTGSASTEIPEWLQNNAGWWAESLITDRDFTEAMQWLIANGVIQI